MANVILLREVYARTRMLDIACSRCTRRGRVSLERMMAELGPDAPIRRVWENLNADCPKRNASIYEQCSVHAPDLPDIMGRG